MNNYILKNEYRVLRPVTVDDAEFIVQLRNQPHVKGFINDTSTDVERQRQWIREYLTRENEYYWIIETKDTHRPYGTTSLYHYDATKRQIETGRWVKMADAPQDNVFAGRIQMNDFVFNVLGVERLVFDVVATNKQVLRYHRMCGAVEIARRPRDVVIQGQLVDQLVFQETPESWAAVRPKICRWAGIDPVATCGEIIKVMI